MEARSPGSALHVSMTRCRVDLDFQALGDQKGEKPCKCLKLMCQSTGDQSLQERGTAPVEEGLKIQGEHAASLKLC